MWEQLRAQFTLMKSHPVIPCSIWSYHECLTCHKNHCDSHQHQSWLTAAHSLHKQGQLLTVQSLLAVGTDYNKFIAFCDNCFYNHATVLH